MATPRPRVGFSPLAASRQCASCFFFVELPGSPYQFPATVRGGSAGGNSTQPGALFLRFQTDALLSFRFMVLSFPRRKYASHDPTCLFFFPRWTRHRARSIPQRTFSLPPSYSFLNTKDHLPRAGSRVRENRATTSFGLSQFGY